MFVILMGTPLITMAGAYGLIILELRRGMMSEIGVSKSGRLKF